MFRLQIKVAEIPGEDFHVLTDFISGYSRINLCSLDVCVAEHLADRLDGHTASEGHGGGESVPPLMESDRLCKEKRTGEDKT